METGDPSLRFRGEHRCHRRMQLGRLRERRLLAGVLLLPRFMQLGHKSRLGFQHDSRRSSDFSVPHIISGYRFTESEEVNKRTVGTQYPTKRRTMYLFTFRIARDYDESHFVAR